MKTLDRSVPVTILRPLNNICTHRDLRIGQVFEILSKAYDELGRDIFYVENDELTEAIIKLEKWINDPENKHKPVVNFLRS